MIDCIIEGYTLNPDAPFTMTDARGFFEWFVVNASYLYVFIFMVVESSFVPFPSEVVVPPAAYLAVTRGDMSVTGVIAFATAGAIAGSWINYWLSVWVGRPVIYRFADSRLGHMFLLDRDKVDKAERYFDSHGAASTFIGRLIPAVRQLISIPAGLARMNIVKFTVFTGLGALLWNCILGMLGWWLGHTVDLATLFQAVEKYNRYLTWGGLGLLVLVIMYMIYKGFKATRHTHTTPD